MHVPSAPLLTDM